MIINFGLKLYLKSGLKMNSRHLPIEHTFIVDIRKIIKLDMRFYLRLITDFSSDKKILKPIITHHKIRIMISSRKNRTGIMRAYS